MQSIEQLLVDKGQRRFGQMGINELEAMFSKNRVLMRSQFQQDIFKGILNLTIRERLCDT